MNENIIILLIGFGFLGVGLFKAYQSWRHKQWIDNSKDWPVTYGSITSTRIDYSWQRNNKRYYAVIGYAYTVMGVKYEGSIRKDEFWGTKGSAEKNSALHPEGSSVNVRYNHINPELHVVDFDTVSSYEIFSATILIIVGLVVLLYSVFTRVGN